MPVKSAEINQTGFITCNKYFVLHMVRDQQNLVAWIPVD